MANFTLDQSASNTNNAINQIKDSTTDLDIDSGTLFVDKSSNRVGIGTSQPSGKLEISGGSFNCNNAGTKSLEYNPYAQTITSAGATLNFTGTDVTFLTDVLVAKQNTQRVGIGTTQPQSKLHVEGIISSYGSSSLNIVDDSGSIITSNNNSEGNITVTHNYHTVSHGATNNTNNVNLININGGVDGAILVLKQTSNDKDIKLIDNTGNLRLVDDFQMNNGNDTITLIKSGSNWFEISRSNNG